MVGIRTSAKEKDIISSLEEGRNGEGTTSGHDIIVVGASAGGVEALRLMVGGLPAHLPAAIFVVVHVPAHAPSILPRLLEQAGPLPAGHAEHGAAIESGRIYVAPPDHHLLVRHGHIEVVRGPPENGHRPAIDVLFRSAAGTHGARVVGVVLSGALDDGTAGLVAVKRQGGVAVVQDPETALFSSMPQSASAHVAVDYSMAPAEIGALLGRLASVPVQVGRPAPERMEREVEIAEMDREAMHRADRPGIPSGFGCPECGGALWELSEGDLLRFRCRVGHAYSTDTLLSEQSEAMEAALWTALRALEESAALSRRLYQRARDSGRDGAAARFAESADAAEGRAELIRRALVNGRDLELPAEG